MNNEPASLQHKASWPGWQLQLPEQLSLSLRISFCVCAVPAR